MRGKWGEGPGGAAVIRAAIYARYSSELQRDRSIADQVDLCRAYAARQGWSIAAVYADHAVSGASIHGRLEFQRMTADAIDGGFEIILAEDVDRLARNQADGARLYERMQFLGIAVWTVADGETNEMHWGLKGTMSAMFLKTHALKVRRGQAGRVRAGKAAGGLCYGYRVLRQVDAAGEPLRGERTIDEAEAEIVRRIFAETLAGRTPREIAAALNRDRVAAPRGGAWNASTINGSRKRGNGILRQELYAGRIVWNRQHFVKNPDTGRRVTRVNAEAERQTAEVPALRIVAEADWRAAQAILAAKGKPSAPARRKSPHLFSGLMRCGVCGGSFISAGGIRPRFKCSRRIESGTCGNGRTIAAAELEERVLASLQAELLGEDVIEAAVRAYAEERRRLKAGRIAATRARERRLGEIDRAVKRVVAMVEEGADRAPLVPRLNALEAERRALLASARDGGADIVEIHPGAAARWRSLVADLRASLAARPDERKGEVVASIRRLVERIEIYPRDDARGRDIEIVGELAALLGPASGAAGMVRMVAEEGFSLPHTMSMPVRIAVRAR